jgi:hypothetical protein
MIPAQICTHFFPRLRRKCDAGLSAPTDCHGCPAYYDGTDFLGLSLDDIDREKAWAQARGERLPRAVFRGQQP